MTSSLRSAATLAAFFGHETQMTASSRMAENKADSWLASSSRLVTNR